MPSSALTHTPPPSPLSLPTPPLFRSVAIEREQDEGVLLGARPAARGPVRQQSLRSEEHTSELQSRGLISYAVFCFNAHPTPVSSLSPHPAAFPICSDRARAGRRRSPGCSPSGPRSGAPAVP